MPTTIWVAFGGALGSVARYWLGIWMFPISKYFPWGTISANILGSFAITFFATLTLENGRFTGSETMRIFFMVGLCGGFTTFSSFSLQTMELLRVGATGRAFINITFSVLLCLGAAFLGVALAHRLKSGV